MRKLLITLLAFPALSFASSLDMNTLKCQTSPDKKTLNIVNTTTLKQVQDNCLIKEQKPYKGMYQVEFKNNTTNKYVKCDFASNSPDAVVNGCR